MRTRYGRREGYILVGLGIQDEVGSGGMVHQDSECNMERSGGGILHEGWACEMGKHSLWRPVSDVEGEGGVSFTGTGYASRGVKLNCMSSGHVRWEDIFYKYWLKGEGVYFIRAGY